MKRLTQAGRLLADLIGVPSVNPAFARDPRTAGEERIAGFIADWAAKQGLESERLPVAPGRSNIVIRWRAPGVRTPRYRILLAPHLDTVGDAGGVPPQLEAQVRGGRMYGRGACDTKGSIASMLTALAAMNQGGPAPPLEIIFTGLVDEENGQAGSRALAGLGWRADLAIVGEPTRLQVVTAHKGDVWLQLETRGRAAHGATPHLGKNAVHLMARVVDLLETEYARQLQRRRHALLGCATVNVGSIMGGTQPNIVPARCAITVDRRTLPGETEPSVRREVMGLLRRHGLAARWLSIRAAPCHSLETDPRLPLVARLLRTARQRKPAGVHYFCDASVLARGGIPSVVFGPGDIAQAHTSDEWIVLAQVDAAAERLERFFRSLT